ncbi:hypothetical protein EVAR_39294_1 [Eumeta japonica]|uniref:Uncharacterized protein n=1 Tax=Eumeta variegata TaxID=151549 RepID=A0A4C1VVH6_EUMVA|nr:hypothetical protein EVAR_39294_1 [Eumeta japonica]
MSPGDIRPSVPWAGGTANNQTFARGKFDSQISQTLRQVNEQRLISSRPLKRIRSDDGEQEVNPSAAVERIGPGAHLVACSMSLLRC